MCIKTLANYVVFTPSGVLVSIDYGPVCGTVRVNDESRPIRSLDTWLANGLDRLYAF